MIKQLIVDRMIERIYKNPGFKKEATPYPNIFM